MTFDEFKKDFIKFLDKSTVNLGRRDTKTRQTFLATVTNKLDAFNSGEISTDSASKKKNINPLSKSVMSIKPKNKRRALNVGKGVHSMTASESALADEQLGRSPYSNGKAEKG